MSRNRVRTKHKAKETTKNKTHKNSDTNLDAQKFIKKYPGFVFAIIFSLIVISLLLASTTITDPELEEKLYYAQQMHIENILFVEDTLLTIEAELDGEYEDTLEDDYLVSIIGDLQWFSNIENEIYNSKPIGDVFVKEIAVAAFRNRMIELNEQFTMEGLDFDQSYSINLALEKEPVQNFVTEEDLLEVFGDKEYDKTVFLETLNYIVKNYFDEKKRIILSSSSIERQFVESKKIILLSY